MKPAKTFSFLKTWWVPFAFWALTFIIYNIGELAKVEAIRGFSFELMIAGIVVLVISTAYQFSKKKWVPAILSLGAIVGTFAFFILIGTYKYVSTIIDGDHWADNLTIPENIPLDTPINMTMDYQRPDFVNDWKKTGTDLQLYNSFQPGIYKYDFWTGRIEQGTIYLKAYEITQDYALTTRSLQEESTIKIYNPTDNIARFSSQNDFTIYEGDWGKPYAAKFEVWFKPDDGGKERKLLEKNFKIEGWMH